MKIYILLIWLFFSFSQSIFCQNEPHFKNQGEQELYWAKKFFEENYKKQTYKRFKGKIKKIGSTFEFGSRGFNLIYSTDGIEILLEQGILYPQIIGGEWVEPDSTDILYQEYLKYKNIGISSFEELKNFTNSPKIKRFWFWTSSGDEMNPDVYLMELTNESATRLTSLKKFVKGAKLTFIKYGWTIL
jgi:hypothetical protein